MSLTWKTREGTAYVTVDEFIAEMKVDRQEWSYKVHPRQTSASLRAPHLDESDQQVSITVTGVTREEALHLCEVIAEAVAE